MISLSGAVTFIIGPSSWRLIEEGQRLPLVRRTELMVVVVKGVGGELADYYYIREDDALLALPGMGMGVGCRR